MGRVISIIVYLFILLCYIAGSIILLDGYHFSSELSNAMRAALWVIMTLAMFLQTSTIITRYTGMDKEDENED